MGDEEHVIVLKASSHLTHVIREPYPRSDHKHGPREGEEIGCFGSSSCPIP